MVPVCACGCKARIDHLRADAKWLSKAHALRWLRANRGARLSDARKRYVGGTRKGGVQLAYPKARECAALLLVDHAGLTYEEAYFAADERLREYVPAKQRARL